MDDSELVANLSLESELSDYENVRDNNVWIGGTKNTKSVKDSILPVEHGENNHENNSNNNNNNSPLLSVEETHHVQIPLNSGDLSLELLQYTSSKHENWGIHSTVWDGGLGLLRYLVDVYGKDWKHVTLCDLGAGTGLVGLGASVASQGQVVVAVTDILKAMPLLSENINLNQKHWLLSGQDPSFPPECGVLDWGKPVSKEWLRQLLERGSSATPKEERTVIITGADVVYRRSLFEPFLSTLCELPTRVREFTDKQFTNLECLLACHSIRSHLNEFWGTARKNGFSVERVAIVELDKDNKLNISNARLELLDSQHRQLPPVTQTKRHEGIVWIVRIRKIPYTFTI